MGGCVMMLCIVAVMLVADLVAANTFSSSSRPCLCIFDVDRTLTGKQGTAADCPSDLEVPGVPDDAYSRGTLRLSVAAEQLNQTFCAQCYLGVVRRRRRRGRFQGTEQTA